MNKRDLILLLALSLVGAAGCTTESYCFDDCDGDGNEGGASGTGQGPGGTSGTSGSSGTGTCWNCGGETATGGTGTGPDACVQTNGGIEICDGIDNDCNGEIDEIFDLSSDIRNCGVCGNDCTQTVIGADQATCTATPGNPGKCGYTQCTQDYHDHNGDPADGCEYYCVKKAETDLTCDNIDDNCDGVIDDGIDFCKDSKNCGMCGRNCQGKAHSIGECITIGNPTTCDESNTKCQIASCDPGWIDANKDFADGCEYQCIRTKRTDPNDPNSLVECGPNEVCDIEYCDGIDNDCDGNIDNVDPKILDPIKGDPLLNQACSGGNQGECAKPYHGGITRCVAAQVRCVNDNRGTTSCTTDADCTDGVNRYCIDSPTPPGKVCGTRVLRMNESPEICDGLDNDCDGAIDDDPTDMGGSCGSNIGLCTQGKYVCKEGKPVCSGAITSIVETCNGADNDCDGVIDGTAAIPTVECQSDSDCSSQSTAKFCMPSTLQGGPAKVCASLPTDIVGANNTPIPCQVPPPAPSGWTSACQAGVLTCVGGAKVCAGAITATASQDQCGVDANCDGLKSPDFDLTKDRFNCGTCGKDCTLLGGHINWICANSQCVPDPNNRCEPGFYDCDSNPNDCEYECTKLSDRELCNGVDDNCNCKIDELESPQDPNGIITPSVTQVCGIGVAATGTCLTGTSVACVSGAWKCTYPPNHCNPSNANCHNTIPPTCCEETADICDGLDNNCNGNTDELFKPPVLKQNYLGQNCASDDGVTPKHGLCQQVGSYQCNGPNAVSCQKGGVSIAGVKVPCGMGTGQSGYPCDEVCDGLDNDCDGAIDEPSWAKGSNATYWVKPSVFRVGTSGPWMFTYEASRHNATANTPGMGNAWWRSTGMRTNQPVPPSGTTLDKTSACSVPGKIPWFNISGREAQHVCVEMGGRLCTNTEWQNACKTNQTGGCKWGFASNCNTFTTSTNWLTCNLGPYDFDPSTTGNQDGLLTTGHLSNCYANWTSPVGRLYDITGNLRELTCQGSANCTSTQTNFTLMGGAFNTADPTGEGAACNFTFYNVNEQFKLFDVGFRCCFDSNPS